MADDLENYLETKERAEELGVEQHLTALGDAAGAHSTGKIEADLPGVGVALVCEAFENTFVAATYLRDEYRRG
nr:hypothetical protein [Halorubrum sp. CSM-61]